jgi:orotate phosphoribosyltransferase
VTTGATVAFDAGWGDAIANLHASPKGQPAFDFVPTEPSPRAPPMTDTERRLLDLLKDRSFRRAPAGEPFTLASGAKSEYFIDGKMTAVSSAGADLIGEVLYQHTKDADIDAVGGLQVGAIPLVTAAAIAYHRHGKPVEGFWVREAAKDHGTKKQIEGGLKPGMRVAIVDDVFTKGGSALKAAQAATEFGCAVVLVLALVDRLQGARALFREHGITDYRRVFTIRQFGIDVPDDLEPAAR